MGSKSIFSTILLCFIIIEYAKGSKILLIAPSLSNSHLLMMGKLADYLVKDQHNVTFFIPEYNPLATANGTRFGKIVRVNNLDTLNFADLLQDFDIFDPNIGSFWSKLRIAELLTNICEAVLKKRHEFEYLKKENFDLVITNGIDFCGVGLAKYLGIKNQITYVPNPIHENTAYYIGVPQPISYVPVVEENPIGPKMGIFDRLWNFKAYILVMIEQKNLILKTNQAFRRQLGQKFPSITNLLSETNLVFVNGNEFLDAARPILHKTVYIGGLGLEDPKPLKEPYTSIMEKGQKGVIMLSFGTIVPTKFIKQDTKEEIFEAFAEFSDYHFLVKIDKNDDLSRKIVSKYENIDVTHWLPQSDLLAHPRLKVLIVHGGYNSLLESAVRGVPVIVMPVFADQYRNGKNVEYRGIGYYLDRLTLGKHKLKQALNTVLNDPSYKASAVRLSQLINDKPFTPEENFLKWTRFVAEHGLLPELQVEGAKMNFIRYFCLDIIFVVVFGVFFLSYIFMYILKFVVILCMQISDRSKIKKD